MMAGKKKARLWEESVVIALRDMQWRLQLETLLSDSEKLAAAQDKFKKNGCFVDDFALRGVIPPGFIPLDGNAESTTADVALSSSSGICFLVEVKSSRERIRDEWKFAKKRKRDVNGGVRSKAAFRAIKSLAEEFENDPRDSECAKLLRRSMRIHQVAYWEASDRGGSCTGRVLAEPYINACIRMRRLSELTDQRCISELEHLVYRFNHMDGDRDDQRVEAREMLTPSTRLQFDVLHDNGERDSRDAQYGADFEEFQKYVNWLCNQCSEGDDRDQPINCIVMTTDGFLQIVSSLRELAKLLKLDLSQTLALTAQPAT